MGNKDLEEKAKEAFEAIRKLSESINRLTDGWGRFVEGIIEPSVVKFLKSKGFKVLEIYPRAKVSRDGLNKEYDLIVVCDKVILLVSAKASVASSDVNELIDDLKDFFFFMQRYKGYELMGAIAGMSYGKGVDTYALRKGLYVFKASGEVMEALEPTSAKIFT